MDNVVHLLEQAQRNAKEGDNSTVIALLIKCFEEQQKRIDALEKHNSDVDKAIDEELRGGKHGGFRYNP